MVIGLDAKPQSISVPKYPSSPKVPQNWGIQGAGKLKAIT